MAELRVDILTLFPETVGAVLHESILGRAVKKGILDIRCTQIRDYTDNRQCQVDDYPYGGGFGCVMMAQPLKSCLDAVVSDAGPRRRRVVYLSPQGAPFTQDTARRLQRDYDHLVLVCGHYEGVDERFIEACVDEEISLGDFVLTGGEIAAMAVTDAVCRLVPGVLSDPQCYIGESHWDGLLEYPQYTRPEVWEGREVPPVLLQGDHEKVSRWRRLMQFARTRSKRPDLFAAFLPKSDGDRELLRELEKSDRTARLTAPVTCRPAAEGDLAALLAIRDAGKRTLARYHVDQWQGEELSDAFLRDAVAEGKCFAVLHGDDIAAFFVLDTEPVPGYDAIRDGKWSEVPAYAALRALAVAAPYRGSGLAGLVIRFAEGEARRLGVRCLRADTHRKNRPMLRLLRENGFRYRGNVEIPAEPGHDARRQAYEKLLKERRT